MSTPTPRPRDRAGRPLRVTGEGTGYHSERSQSFRPIDHEEMP